MPIQFPDQEPRYVGAVLDDREENGYHDSDFYAVVWDAEEARLKRVGYNSTRHAGGGSCKVDATPEVYEKAKEWLFEWAKGVIRQKYEEDSTACVKDRKVRVVKGRKVPKGTEGILFWKGEYQHYTKVGIALSEEKDEKGGYKDVAWTYLKNIEVVEPSQYIPDDEAIEEEARAFAEKGVWCAPFARYQIL